MHRKYGADERGSKPGLDVGNVALYQLNYIRRLGSSAHRCVSTQARAAPGLPPSPTLDLHTRETRMEASALEKPRANDGGGAGALGQIPSCKTASRLSEQRGGL